MDPNMAWSSLALLAAGLLVGGLATGFAAGLLGIGGGAILVPVLYQVFTLLGVEPAARMHLTVGTGLAVIIPTTLRSLQAHRARGAVDMALVRRLAPWVLAGVGGGIVFARTMPGWVLTAVWVTFTVVLILKLLFGRPDWRLGDDVPSGTGVGLYASFVGAISTVMSIGGGAYMTLLMTLYGRGIHQAVGTSSAFGPIIAVPGVVGFVWAGWGAPGLPPASLGYVSLIGAAILIPASVLAAPWGVRVAHGFSRRKLELALAVFLIAACSRFLPDVLG